MIIAVPPCPRSAAGLWETECSEIPRYTVFLTADLEAKDFLCQPLVTNCQEDKQDDHPTNSPLLLSPGHSQLPGGGEGCLPLHQHWLPVLKPHLCRL